MPKIEPGLRAWLTAARARHGLPAFRRSLRLLDPRTAARTTEGDTQRTLRALELALASGHPQSWWISQQPFAHHALPAQRIALTLPRTVLYHRIAERSEEHTSELQSH